MREIQDVLTGKTKADAGTKTNEGYTPKSIDYETMANLASQQQYNQSNESYDGGAGEDAAASGGYGDQNPNTGTDYGGTYKGSLITRNKPSKKKPKKMKQGGLASR